MPSFGTFNAIRLPPRSPIIHPHEASNAPLRPRALKLLLQLLGIHEDQQGWTQHRPFAKQNLWPCQSWKWVKNVRSEPHSAHPWVHIAGKTPSLESLRQACSLTVRMMCFRCVLFSIFSVDKDSENLRSSRLHIGNQTLFLLVILPIEQLSFLPLSQSLQSFPVRLSGLDLPPQALPETLHFSCMCAKPCCNDQTEIAPCKLKAQKETIYQHLPNQRKSPRNFHRLWDSWKALLLVRQALYLRAAESPNCHIITDVSRISAADVIGEK